MNKTKEILTTVFCTMFYVPLLSCSVRQRIRLTPDNTHINWDLHDNAVQHDYSAIASIIARNSCAIMGALINKELRTKFKKLKDASAPGEAFVHLLEQHDQHKLAQVFRQSACLQKVTPGILPLMAKLKALNYKQYYCSNIGPEFLEDLKEQIPELFEYLPEGTVAVYDPLTHSVIAKPNRKFYDMHNYTYNPLQIQRPILVDNRLENVLAARQAGWCGIHFTGNVPQLYKEFQKLRIEIYPDS